MKIPVIILLILIAVVGLFFWPQNLSDEEAIHQNLNHAIAGLSEKDLSLIMDTISEEYIDEDRLDKKSLKGILFQQFQRNNAIFVQLTERELIITPPMATIKAHADVLAGSLLDKNGTQVSFSVEITFQKEEQDWRITSYKKTRILP